MHKPNITQRISNVHVEFVVSLNQSLTQGPRSNFEIGEGGGHDWILGGGGKIHFFLLTLYNFKNIGGEGTCPPCPPPPPLLRGPC